MRLLRCDTLAFETFEGDNVPRYAILSHTWGDKEILFDNVCQRTLTGSNKVTSGRDQAVADGLKYFWVDTCCIDKSNSAELSEAINSMFLWYKNAAVCYIYLSDVSVVDRIDPFGVSRKFGSSRWWKRGWTLQELIAPSNAIFFTKEWVPIGTKDSLRGRVRRITQIPARALKGENLNAFSVAQKMSWASKRETTRVEDMSYSLLGLFGVNMPLIYGERKNAFLRLQEEIMKSTDDQSLFAWMEEASHPEGYSGLLAGSPHSFANSGRIKSFGAWAQSDAFAVTNKGLRVELFLIPFDEGDITYYASLDCCFDGERADLSPVILLKCVSGREGIWTNTPKTQFARIRSARMDKLSAEEKRRGRYRTIYVRQNPAAALVGPASSAPPGRCFRMIRHHPKNLPTDPVRVFPLVHWNLQTKLFQPSIQDGKCGAAQFDLSGEKVTAIFGLHDADSPWVHILPSISNPEIDKEWLGYKTTGKETAKCRERFTVNLKRIALKAEVVERYKAIENPQPQHDLKNARPDIRFPAIVQVPVEVAEKGFVPLPLHRIQTRGQYERLGGRGVGEGVVDARLDGGGAAGCEVDGAAVEIGAEGAAVDVEGLGLVAVPVVGGAWIVGPARTVVVLQTLELEEAEAEAGWKSIFVAPFSVVMVERWDWRVRGGGEVRKESMVVGWTYDLGCEVDSSIGLSIGDDGVETSESDPVDLGARRGDAGW
ncbi:uncharacterized protein KY384_005705 [Bacidia gigantensis]|uniref:uncharacterized protein n=1 Tax=Bacidia gigantensis TaxID=2732470 RepID=UPI001D04931F|nr:uncharacterized protein KY384_005705 [Bacidia gigantensis]KAG8529070.1 hypothetical protein KY384_005705 [Bacidia gigantensis]